jgi:hypothetical protein
MGNRRPLGHYFDAARSQQGISEREVRSLVAMEAGNAKRSWRGRSSKPLGLASVAGIIAVAVGAYLMWHGSAPDGSAMRRLPAMQAVTASAGSARDGAATEPANPTAGAATRTTNDYQHSIHREDRMISMRRLHGAALIAAVMGASVPVHAQSSSPVIPAHPQTVVDPHHEPSPMMKQLHAALGQTVVDYWTPKLNNYKVRIDKMLAPSDLDELNRLRVRFNVLANEWLRGDDETRHRFMEQEKEELTGIYNSVRQLADRYRPDADALGNTVLQDVTEFFPQIVQRMDDFTAAHREEIDNAGSGGMLAKARQHVNDVVDLVHQGQAKMIFKMIYPAGLEPILMLYDGTDLKTMLHHIEQLAMHKGVTSLSSDAIAGYALPDESLLSQSVPNPASTSAQVTYHLAEPSGATVLRLFNAKGDLAGTYDEGSQPAGDHVVTLDLSALPSGTYLYHLTLQTSNGERVVSKTLQVVR